VSCGFPDMHLSHFLGAAFTGQPIGGGVDQSGGRRVPIGDDVDDHRCIHDDLYDLVVAQ
jgi:hypothetical protein